MSYCLNPQCQKPENLTEVRFCQNCGTKLLLGDRYRSLKAIGQGGFGRTFLAVDEYKPSKPYCVIKQFFPQAQGTNNSQKAAELFQQEAVRLDELGKHPQIPELLAYFTQDERQYLVQEFIDGQNLAQELAESGCFKETQIRHLLNDLLPLLQFIHEGQVIHRDIKPENIIRRRADQKLVLVDFGAAKFATGTALERTGTKIGSAEYFAPEQGRGKAIFASDLYSLGVTCIHLLTQVSPFDLFDVNEDAWVWQQYLGNNSVSAELSSILDKLVQNAINQRYKSVDDVLKALNTKKKQATTTTPPQVPSQKAATQKLPLSSFAGLDINAEFMALKAQIETCFHLDKTIMLRNLYTGTIYRTLFSRLNSLSSHSGYVYAVNFSPDGKTLASGSADRTIKLWYWRTGDLISTISGHLDTVWSVAFSPNGKVIASGSADKTIKLWDFPTGKLTATFTGHSSWVNTVAISPDGQIIASGSKDKTIKIWNLATGELIHTLEGHSDAVLSVAISPDGETIASGSKDNTIKLWNLRSGRSIGTLSDHSAAVKSVVFSQDGQSLASGSWDRTIKIWRYI